MELSQWYSLSADETPHLSLGIRPGTLWSLQCIQQRERPCRVVRELLREEVVHDRMQPARPRDRAVLLEQRLQVAADRSGLAAGPSKERDALCVLLEVVVGLAEVRFERHGSAGQRAKVRSECPECCKAGDAVPARLLPPVTRLNWTSSTTRKIRERVGCQSRLLESTMEQAYSASWSS